MPTVYEVIFWFCMLVGAYGLGFIFMNKEDLGEVSEYELDRLNGIKY
jgi:hypothetical protein